MMSFGHFSFSYIVFQQSIGTVHCSTPLIQAARNAITDDMEMALETGADVNGRDCMGRTALHW